MSKAVVSRKVLVSALLALLAISALLAAVSPLFLHAHRAEVAALSVSSTATGKFFETVSVDPKAVAAAATLSNHKLKHVARSPILTAPAHAAFLAHPAKPLEVAKAAVFPVEDSDEAAQTQRDVKRASALVDSSAAMIRKSAADLPVRAAKPIAMRTVHPVPARPLAIRNGFRKPMSSKLSARTQLLLSAQAAKKPLKLDQITGYAPQTFDAPTSLHPATPYMIASDPNRPEGLNGAAGYTGFQQQGRYYDERGNRLPDDLAPPSANVNMRPPSDLPQWQTGYNQPPLFESDGGGGAIDSLGNNDNEQYPVQRSDLSSSSESPIPFHT